MKVLSTRLFANNFAWYMNDGLFSNDFHESYNFDSSGVYQITLVAWYKQEHCADTFSLKIIVYDSLIAQIPNVFTPNNDGVNDIFNIQLQGAKAVHAYIYNRWGDLVYQHQSDIPSSPQTIDLWNGNTPTGEAVTEGVYYYVIELTDMQDEVR